jgi:hypothetical protein
METVALVAMEVLVDLVLMLCLAVAAVLERNLPPMGFLVELVEPVALVVMVLPPA